MQHPIHRVCPACDKDGRDDPALSYGPAEWPIKRCRACGFVYLERAAAYEEMVDNFSWEKTSAAESARREQAEPLKQSLSNQAKAFRRGVLKRDKVTRLILKYFPPGRVLDVGCGGKLRENLPEKYRPMGIEISAALAAKAAKRAAARGGEVLHADALSGLRRLPDQHLSGVVMSAFLEHELQPRPVLMETLRVLEPGGGVIIKVPNFASWNRVLRGRRWCGFRFPDHVNYFTPESLARLAESAGFEVRRCRIGDRMPTSDNLWMVLQRPV